MPTSLQQRLAEHLASIDVEQAATQISAALQTAPAEAERELRMYMAEAHVALGIVEPHLRTGMRILEVGSGIGMFAAFLHCEGFDIVELEPVGLGFDFIAAARAALHTNAGPPHLDFPVETIDAEGQGRFDLVYSLNVLEHVEDWRLALDAICGVLAPSGRLVASCPNYALPYEPHFGLPLVPVRPALTSRFVSDATSSSDLWQSLNWITHGQLTRWARDRFVTVRFERGLLTRVSDRLNDDDEFRRRHGGLLRGIARVLRLTRIDRLLAAAPPAIVTPMEFVVSLD